MEIFILSYFYELPCNIGAIIFLQISQSLYMPYIENVSLFRGCSSEFINQIVSRLYLLRSNPGKAAGFFCKWHVWTCFYMR